MDISFIIRYEYCDECLHLRHEQFCGGFGLSHIDCKTKKGGKPRKDVISADSVTVNFQYLKKSNEIPTRVQKLIL